MKWLLLFLGFIATPALAQTATPRSTVAITTIAGNQVLIPRQPNGMQISAIVLIGAAGNIQFQYGTGTTCGTGTQPLSGVMPVTAAGLVVSSGGLPVLIVPPNVDLCASTS